MRNTQLISALCVIAMLATFVIALATPALAAADGTNGPAGQTYPDQAKGKKGQAVAIYDRPTFSGLHTQASATPNWWDNVLSDPAASPVTGTSYYFNLEAQATAEGMTWFQDHTSLASDGAYYLDARGMRFVVEIEKKGVSSADLTMSYRYSLYFGDPATSNPGSPWLAQWQHVNGKTIKSMLTPQPYVLYNVQKVPIVSYNDASTFRAFGPTAVYFNEPGDYTMSFYLVDGSGAKVSPTLTQTLSVSLS